MKDMDALAMLLRTELIWGPVQNAAACCQNLLIFSSLMCVAQDACMLHACVPCTPMTLPWTRWLH